jgi:hypothetical protein
MKLNEIWNLICSMASDPKIIGLIYFLGIGLNISYFKLLDAGIYSMYIWYSGLSLIALSALLVSNVVFSNPDLKGLKYIMITTSVIWVGLSLFAMSSGSYVTKISKSECGDNIYYQYTATGIVGLGGRIDNIVEGKIGDLLYRKIDIRPINILNISDFDSNIGSVYTKDSFKSNLDFEKYMNCIQGVKLKCPDFFTRYQSNETDCSKLRTNLKF